MLYAFSSNTNIVLVKIDFVFNKIGLHTINIAKIMMLMRNI